MARLYANENFPLPVVERLRTLGHDVVTSQDAGNAGQAVPDIAVLQFAVQNKRALLTLNRRHFIKLHATNGGHEGIVTCTYDANFHALADRIHAALGQVANLGGCLVRINRPA